MPQPIKDFEMLQLAFVSASTAIFAVLGFAIGVAIDGLSPPSLIPAVAGGFGGFGIGCATLRVLRRWRARDDRRASA
jgi:hypothetical protein